LSIEVIKEYIDPDGSNVVFSAGNNKIFSGTTTLTDETPVAYTVTANDWKMVNFNDSIYMFPSVIMSLWCTPQLLVL
jgi:hypothetical protein